MNVKDWIKKYPSVAMNFIRGTDDPLLHRIIQEYADEYHKQEVNKITSKQLVSGRSEQLQNDRYCENKKMFNCTCVNKCMDFTDYDIL